MQEGEPLTFEPGSCVSPPSVSLFFGLAFMKRRDWIRTMGAAGFGSAALSSFPWAAADRARAGFHGTEVRNIIFFALDGTGYEDLATASFYAERILGRPLAFRRVLAQGQSGSMFPHSLTSVVTDSAAATSAWCTGQKLVNGALSQLPDGRNLDTIFDLAKDRGKATGLVTSARITHATPAGWGANVAARAMEEEIAEQYLDRRIDVLLGGGAGPFQPSGRSDGRDLLAEARSAGYEVLLSEADLAASTGSRLLGAFTPGTQHLAYEVDRRYQDAPSPSLAQVTARGLEALDGAEGGFVLQVEAGRIDHANHENDGPGMLWDWLAADEALEVILDYADRVPGTLVICAADHDTGGGTLFGIGPGYRRSTQAFETLQGARGTLGHLRGVLGSDPSSGAVEEAVQAVLGFRPTADQVAHVRRIQANEETFGHPSAHGGQLNSLAWVLYQPAASTPEQANLAFSTGAHTGGLVPVFRYGAGVEPGSLGTVDNTELFHWMTAALGQAGFENPGMSEGEALRFAAADVDEPGRPHWV